jgi:hypothetical protein
MTNDQRRPWLKAYELASTEGWSIEPAPAKREWMDATFKPLSELGPRHRTSFELRPFAARDREK